MSIAIVLLFVVCGSLHVGGQKHPEFPQWDMVHWVVPYDKPEISLPCSDPSYYPFNNLSSAIKVEWILPERSAYLHLQPGHSNEGWVALEAAANYSLVINKAGLNVEEAAVGMYVCAVLANIPGNSSLFAWYYLRWGVGLYSHVAAMNAGGIERYNFQFLIAGVSLLVYAVIATLFSLVCYFYYKGGPVDDMDEEKLKVRVDDVEDSDVESKSSVSSIAQL